MPLLKALGVLLFSMTLISCSILESLDEQRRAVPNADDEHKEYVNKSLHHPKNEEK